MLLVKEVADLNGHKTSIGYEAHGYPVSTQLPDGSSITRRFDGRGRLLAKARPGGETTFSYNELDHLVEQVTQLEGGPAMCSELAVVLYRGFVELLDGSAV